MSNAPVCHISTGSQPINQPRPTLLPSIPTAVDLPSAIAAIQALKLLVQMLAGQQPVSGSGSFPRNGGGFSSLGSSGSNGAPGQQGQKGQEKNQKNENDRFVEDRSQRVEKKIRIFQNNDKKSENWVDIKQINRVVWVDKVTGGRIVWTR